MVSPRGEGDFQPLDGKIVATGGGIQVAEGDKYLRLLRKDRWIAFRAFAGPQTPFGTVVRLRRRLLKGSGEFDTYWDNVTTKK